MIVGAVGLGACLVYVLALATAKTFASALAITGVALSLTIGGLLRRWRGRTLPGSSERLRALQDAPGPVTAGIGRLFAFALDLCMLVTLALGAFQLFRWQSFDYEASRLCDALSQPDLAGLAFLRAHALCFSTRTGIEELSAGLATLACGLYLLAPAAAWGATPGMLLVGRVWVRDDSQRVGAVHGVVRALVGLLLSPLQAVVALLLTVNFANRYRNVRTGETFTVTAWGVLALARRPRTFADRVCRTEAITRRA
jgi:hypothetical protein